MSDDFYREKNGWIEYRKLVLLELERLNSKYDQMDKKITAIQSTQAENNLKLQNELATLRTRVATISGIAATVLSIGVNILLRLFT